MTEAQAARILDDASDVRAAFFEALAPPPFLTVSEWADEYRILPDTSAEPGRWRTSRAPYLREILDSLSPHVACDDVVVVKAAQIGWSEVLNNWIGYTIAANPAPMMLLQPTEGTAQKYSKQRIAPMLEASPALRDRVSAPKSKDSGNTILEKQFPGGFLAIVGANAPSGLASIAVRNLAGDEIDRYPPSAGAEGDPWELAKRRTTTFPDAKRGMGSTPTIKGVSRIWAAYEETDRREYRVPCPECDHRFPLSFSVMHWDGDPRAACCVCPDCGAIIEERTHKPRMLAGGEWVARNPEVTRRRGYHVPGWLSPWLRWGDICAAFVEAKDDPPRLQVVINTMFGEVWDPHDDEDLGPDDLAGLAEPYPAPVPAGVGLLTAGVDIQADRIEVEIVGWGVGEESWRVDLVVLSGDTASPGGVWQSLDDVLVRTYAHESGSELPVAAACIDSGYASTLVYDFCRGKGSRRVWATKGVAGPGRRVWPRQATRTNKGRIPLYIVGVEGAKDVLRARLKRSLDVRRQGLDAAAGAMHFPLGRTFDRRYFEQLLAEQPRIRAHKGHPIREWWLPNGRRNEAIDLEVLAYAAMLGVRSQGGRLEDLVAEANGDTPATVRPPADRKKRRGLIKRRRLL